MTMKTHYSGLVALLLVSSFVDEVRCGLKIPVNDNPVTLANEIASKLNPTNVRLVGRSSCARMFRKGGSVAGPLLPKDGVALSTGRAAALIFQDNLRESSCWNNDGDDDLSNLVGRESFDACTLEFDFESPDEGILSINYVFASDEYNEVDPPRDAFGFFLNGRNIATIPGTSMEVSVRTVNRDKNKFYYVDNDPSSFGMADVPYRAFEPNGFTKKFTATGETVEGTNHLKLTIADTMDCETDSWVLIEKDSIDVRSSFALQSEPLPTPASSLQIALPSEAWAMIDFIAPDFITWNVHLTGNKACARVFTAGGGAAAWGLDFPESGLILSTGSAKDLKDQTSDGKSTCWSKPGDQELTSLIRTRTLDACVLEFNFDSPEGRDIYFDYVFASDEYNEFKDSTAYDDAFAFFLNGQNIALVPGTNEMVRSSTVNSGKNSRYYNDNDPSDFNNDPPYPKFEADGFTARLRATGPTVTGANHLKMVIADTTDCETDSWVLVEEGSFDFVTMESS